MRIVKASLYLLPLLILFFYGCDGQEKLNPLQKGIKTEILPDQQSINSTVNFSDSGKVIAILHAGIIKMYYTRNETLLENNMQVDFYDENTRIEATINRQAGQS